MLGDKPEPALNLIEPTGVGRRVMDDAARMTCEPGFDPWMFVGGIVVGDQMDFEVGWNVAVEVLKKGEKCLMAVTRLALGDDRAVEHINARTLQWVAFFGLLRKTRLISPATCSSP